MGKRIASFISYRSLVAQFLNAAAAPAGTGGVDVEAVLASIRSMDEKLTLSLGESIGAITIAMFC